MAISLFPAFVMILAVSCVVWLAMSPSWRPLGALFFSLYALPLLSFRLHNSLCPLREGGSRIVGATYSSWYGGHQIQAIYLAFPALEAAIRLVPGAYSMWLRLWGSRVGKRVYWTPLVEISDRSLVEIGNHVVFGHRSGLLSHVITPRKGSLLLYVGRVRIGDGAFIGAGSYIGAGSTIEPGVMLPVESKIHPRRRISA